MSVKEVDFGESRGIALAALATGGAFIGLAIVMIGVLAALAPAELAPLRNSDHELRRFAEMGHFPLIAAAVQANRAMFGVIAGAQTFGAFALLFFAAAYFGWRGFVSGRSRGWSNAVWIFGLIAICVTPSLFPELTPQWMDYGIIASLDDGEIGLAPGPLGAIYGAHGLNRRMSPVVFIVERGIVGALAVVALAFIAHDLGYRLREALEDFGFIDVEEARRPAAAQSGAASGAGRPSGAAKEAPHAGFGQRAGAPAPAQSDEARARAALGVGVSATRREIERAYRAQMKRAHPDHGGSDARAAALNAARDALLRRG